MRPISVRFCGFGPYVKEQLVDFTMLEKSGVFLICGETGAGKTTILDAMCYALYGRSSGGIRGDLSVMRCKLCSREEETMVEFIFEVNDRRYRFTRSLKYARKNINDFHNCAVLEDGVYVPLLENPKATFVNKKAEELIGLTYDQFRQVIILPQGQFEKLLVSDSAQKEEILVSLFRAENWQRIADEVYRRVAERDTALKESLARVMHGLAEYECTTVEALYDKLGEQQARLAEMQEEQQTANAAFAKEKTAYEKALLEYKDFEELKKRRARLAKLQESASHHEAIAVALRFADDAESIRVPYEAYDAARTTLNTAHAHYDRACRSQREAEAHLKHAVQARQLHENGKDACEENKRLLTLYDNARATYRERGKKQAAVAAAQKRAAADRTAAQAAQSAFEKAQTIWLQSMNTQREAIAAYQTAQEQYLSSVGSVLAERLRTGEPCPVCGSMEHPAPAPRTAQQVTEAQLEQLNKAVKAAGDAVSEAADARTAAEKTLHSSRDRAAQAEQELAVAQSAYAATLTGLIEGIETEKALEQAIARLLREVAAYDQAESQTLAALSKADGDAKAAALTVASTGELLEITRKDFECAETAWEKALEEKGFESVKAYRDAVLSAVERNEHRTALVAYQTSVEQARLSLREQEALVDGRTCPDVAAIRLRYEQAAELQQQLAASLALAADRVQTMMRVAKELSARKAAHDEERTRVDADLEYAKHLQGRSGVSLQRYVLGVMLSSITVAANRLLQNVHSGRYQLFRTDEIAGSSRKGGLELEVYDARHNERRSVTTLSGGEKFLVSLSLAIGLSTVVQAQGSGVRLEAMFIDEGFGSLDRESIADALDVLQGVHRGKGVVGIISHVEQLAETIPAKIVISKGKDGSHCHISI